MGLNATAIETLSVSAVRDSIAMSDFLEPFIADNDKEPSWDGHVYIYENKHHRKESLKGRLSVQVKGKECSDFSQEAVSYSITTVDLKNYLYDGGVIFFVVYISNGGLSRKIYYIELPPIKLRVTLASVKGKQKTKTVELKEFPNDNNKKATIFLNCLQNCQKQTSFTDAKLLSLNELEEQGLLEGITIPISVVGIEDPQRALVTNEVYIYAKVKGSAIPQPLEHIPEHIVTSQELNSIIAIEDAVYYTKIQLIKTAEKTTFKFGESFTISFADKNQSCTIYYKDSTKVRTLVRDLDFILAYIKYGYFKMDDLTIPFDHNEVDFSEFSIEEHKQRLEFAKRTVEALDMLNCNKDVDLCQLNIEDRRNLERLITAFVDKQPVFNIRTNLPTIIKLNVGTLSFALCLQTCDGLKNAYYMYDFFKTELSMAYQGKEGEKLPISQYAILHADDFLKIDNIRFDKLFPSFQKVTKNYDTYNRANWFLLDLLIAFDKSNGERIEILKTAHQFADWILQEASDEDIPYQIRILNYLQVIKREREFNISELAKLYSLVECNTTREDALIGAYLLLGQQRAAEIHYKKLEPEIQDGFKSYPIYHFWIKAENEDIV